MSYNLSGFNSSFSTGLISVLNLRDEVLFDLKSPPCESMKQLGADETVGLAHNASLTVDGKFHIPPDSMYVKLVQLNISPFMI